MGISRFRVSSVQRLEGQIFGLTQRGRNLLKVEQTLALEICRRTVTCVTPHVIARVAVWSDF